jgi:4,5-dihydroxyphthalate decarboxylase
LAEQYGVNLDAIQWRMTSDEHVESFEPPPNASYSADRLEPMLARGEIAAVVGTDLAGGDAGSIAPLLADVGRAAGAWYSTNGFIPVNHTVVVRDEIARSAPWIVARLCDAFSEARRVAVDEQRVDPDVRVNVLKERDFIASIGGNRLLRDGLEANREAIDSLTSIARAQQLISTPLALEDLFHQA